MNPNGISAKRNESNESNSVGICSPVLYEYREWMTAVNI